MFSLGKAKNNKKKLRHYLTYLVIDSITLLIALISNISSISAKLKIISAFNYLI